MKSFEILEGGAVLKRRRSYSGSAGKDLALTNWKPPADNVESTELRKWQSKTP